MAARLGVSAHVLVLAWVLAQSPTVIASPSARRVAHALDSVRAGALGELRREGKVRWVGLSNVSVAQVRAAEAIGPVASVQNRLNPFFREVLEDGVVRYCAEQGIGFLAYSPTGGGRLNRKLPEHPVLRPMAARLGVSAHVLVLAWVLAQSPTVIAIPSARRVAHALDSVRAGALELSPEDLTAIDRAPFSRA
jgi:aryl-alcohol dehydrogenase-like predicted oxidoreductase